MLTLGIETSGRQGSVAVTEDGRLLSERTWSTADGHARRLQAEIGRLLADLELNPQDLGAVAVSFGPGSFTGLRIGVVCAKTFAYATGCHLAAVETFHCIAENSPAEVNEVFVIEDARRGDLYAGRYFRSPQGLWHPVEPAHIVDGEEWMAERQKGEVISGPGVHLVEETLSARCRILPDSCRVPQARTIASLGNQLVRAGQTADLWALEPFYLRRSAAEDKWEKSHPAG